ncbi:MAG: thioredoxin family protein [Candidatus Dormibacteria bacterium]
MAVAPLLAVAVLLGAAGLVGLQRRHQARLVGGASETAPEDLSDILYFTGAACTICHVAQRPALGRLAATRGDITVREIDVAREPEMASRYRVMTLPTTVVLDVDGRIAAINTGFAGEALLAEQVDGARRRLTEASVA